MKVVGCILVEKELCSVVQQIDEKYLRKGVASI